MIMLVITQYTALIMLRFTVFFLGKRAPCKYNWFCMKPCLCVSIYVSINKGKREKVGYREKLHLHSP